MILSIENSIVFWKLVNVKARSISINVTLQWDASRSAQVSHTSQIQAWSQKNWLDTFRSHACVYMNLPQQWRSSLHHIPKQPRIKGENNRFSNKNQGAPLSFPSLPPPPWLSPNSPLSQSAFDFQSCVLLYVSLFLWRMVLLSLFSLWLIFTADQPLNSGAHCADSVLKAECRTGAQ